MSARFALRSATSDVHDRLDRQFSRFDLTDRRGYGDFLLAQASAFLGVEAALDRAGAGGLIPDWPERRRAAALRRDLAAMDLSAPPTDAGPAFSTEAAVLGGVYVLEGSRLGGAVLIRSIPPGVPRSFLSPGNPSAWRAFVELLDQRLSSPESVEDAVAAATAVFEVFASSACNFSGAERP